MTRTPRYGPLFLAAGAVILTQEAPGAMHPRVIETRFPTDDVVIASLVVEAPRDGGADATAAIQAAIDEAAAAGGSVVFLPAGRYRLEGRLTVREGVTLRGDWTPPTQPGASGGTVLMPVADRGNADGPPAITLERGSGVREVTVWYPDQRPTEIVPYPWTFKTSEAVVGDNYTVHNVTLVNPYQAIKVGPESNELHTVRNVYGTPLKVGIFVDTCTDIGRLIDVDFGPQWWERSGFPGAPTGDAEQAAVRGFMLREGIGLDIGRSDWEYIHQVSLRGYFIGARFRAGVQGTTNAVMFGCNLQDCATALVLDQLNPIGLSATGCSFEGADQAVLAPESFDATAQFHTCSLRSSGGSAVALRGRGTLTLQNCELTAWQHWGLDAASGQVCVLGTRFLGPARHVRLGPDLMRARLLGNRFPGDPDLHNGAAGADVQISHRDLAFGTPDVSRYQAPPDRAPATRDLFVVTDFGARPELEDNTAAFMAALQAARQAGGGTVYVPAGRYRFAGELVVPTGVELRGCFDVPHHTVSGGSVLMPTAGRGNAEGTPFVRLEPRSGLRGLTLWYPEQNHSRIEPYPWAIQSTGPGCWLLDVTLGNAYQGADFWTYPSDGHLIRYLAGGFLRRGLFISKCAGEGWVEDVQFNPHYAFRLPPNMPQPPVEGDPWNTFLAHQWHHLEGIVVGSCQREHLKGTFLYAAYDGLVFREDGGGANARVIQHGTDAGSRGVVMEATGPEGVDFLNAQIVHFGPREQAALVVTEGFTGRVRLFNSQMWAGPRSGNIAGSGEVLIQQLNTLTGPFTISGGRCAIENAHFTGDLNPHIRVEAGAREVRLLGNTSPDHLRILNQAADALWARSNAASLPPRADQFTFRSGWEDDDPQGLADTIAHTGGGRLSVSQPECRPSDQVAHGGRRSLRVAGIADDPAYSYCYFRVVEGPLGVNPDSVLSYWIQPGNELGRYVGVDLLFSDGSTLRDSGAQTTDRQGVHPQTPRGTVGAWTKITIPIGRWHARKVIAAIMVAFDSRAGSGPFEAFLDDLRLESPWGAVPWRVTAHPGGGTYDRPVVVELAAEGGAGVRYTLDGTPPTADSPRYETPIVLGVPGLWELRFVAQDADGALSPVVHSALYDVTIPAGPG